MAICSAQASCQCTSQGSCRILTLPGAEVTEYDDSRAIVPVADVPRSLANSRYMSASRMVAPINFGTVEPGLIYRSGYPISDNFTFLASYLRVKTIITLVPEPLPEEYEQFLFRNHITHIQIHVPANKDGCVRVTQSTMDEVLATILSHNHEPILIHCNRGKHRTGCAVACLRKAQGRPMASSIREYTAFAAPKIRADDIDFIEKYEADHFAPMVERQRWISTPTLVSNTDLFTMSTSAIRAS